MKFHPRPHFRLWMRASVALISLWQLSLFVHVDAAVLCVDLLLGCTCLLGRCGAEGLTILSPLLGTLDICDFNDDCYCDTNGECVAKPPTLSPTESFAPSESSRPSLSSMPSTSVVPSLSLTPSVSTSPSESAAPSDSLSPSSSPSESMVPSPPGGLSLCALINPCSCLLGQCRNALDLAISAAGICIAAADCACDELTGVCDTATSVPSARPSTSLVPSTSLAPSDLPSSSLAPSPPGGLSLCALINPCSCLLGQCQNALDFSISAAGICIAAADCACDELTGVCDTATSQPSMSLAPSGTPSRSLAPSSSLAPSPSGGISLCALINPCACVAGACENVMYTSISAAGICVVAADCSCNEITGVCDTATAAPSVSLSPSESSSPSQSPSSSLAPSLSLVPSPPGGISLCALINPCACVAGACENVLYTSISAAGICVVAADCSCNELTGVCDTATATPSVSLSPSISSSPSQSPSSSLAPSLSLVPSPPGGISLCALINPCACVAGACENVLDASISAAGICVVAADCSCNELTGVCDTATVAPSVSLSPSISSSPSQSPSSSLAPSLSLVPSPPGGISLCALVNPCACVAGACENVLDASISAAGICVVAVDCSCNELTGVCDTATAAPSVSLSPSISSSPSQSPSSSLAPSSSLVPSPPGGISLCALINPCACVAGACENVLDASISAAGICVVAADCSCNEVTGVCDTATAAPSVTLSPSESFYPSQSSLPSVSSIPSTSSVPSASSSPSVSSWPSGSIFPTTSSVPSTSQSPSTSSIPSESISPSITFSPSASQFPSFSIRPTSSFYPSASSSPSESTLPSISSFPSESLGPTLSLKPSLSMNPSISSIPSESSFPSISSSPSTSHVPSFSIKPSFSMNPSLSSSPSESALPSISSSPSTSQFPSSSSSPSLSLQPSVSLQPSLSIKPSVSSNPSISLLPTTSQLPSASPSTSPSNSKEPTHLPSQTPSVSMVPSANPSGHPSLRPSTHPSISLSPTAAPSSTPSISHKPSDFPTSSPSAYPSRDCQAPTIGCGFGMWNYYTCECQCISPYCPDATGACYQTYSCPIDNYFEGCSHDCPWYADTLSETCVQGEVVPTGVSQVYMTKMRCCQAEFPNSVSACMDLQGVDEAYWYPDWTSGSSSCRNDGNQPDYMNADAQYWLFEDPYQCCKKYFGWDEDSCISSSIQGTDYVPPPSSPNVVLYYSCRICFSDCPNILNNLDESIPIIGNAIFSAVCNGNCNTGDSVQFDSVCGQSVDIDIPYSGNRRLKEGLHRRKVQTVITPCIEFTIKIYAQSASEAAILYNHLYLVLGTSPTQFDTLQTIQSYIQMVASTSLPLLSAIVIDGYSHVSYSIIGLSPNYYPDWGHTETCKNDGGEPAYMVNNPSYFSSSMEECCERYYYWKKNECMNAESAVVVAANPCSTSSSSSTSSGSTFTGRYYPDWTNGNRCLSDGNEPDYMRAWPVTWIFDNLEDCCDQHFQWDIENCMSSVSSSNPCNTQVVTPCVTTGVVVEGTANTIGTYYPDWLGSNLCVNDGNAPQYMKNWPYTHPAGWFFVTLEDCCRQHFSWTLSKCLGYVSANPCPVNGSVISTATTATPLTTSTTTSDPNAGAEWYVDWTIYRCVQSCDGPSPCGGLASYWEETYETAERCCAEHLSYQNECTP